MMIELKRQFKVGCVFFAHMVVFGFELFWLDDFLSWAVLVVALRGGLGFERGHCVVITAILFDFSAVRRAPR